MSIWKKEITLEKLQQNRSQTLDSQLGIEYIEIGEDFIKGKMPVDVRTRQPFGILHGGASCVLAESLGSIGGYYCLDDHSFCVGQSINTNHIRMAKEGFVYGTAKPIHLGARSQIWEIDIRNEEGKLVSVTRLTLAVLAK